MSTRVKCGKCLKTINDSISASVKCKKCENWIHKKCAGLSSSEFSKVVTASKKHSHNWTCNFCTKNDTTENTDLMDISIFDKAPNQSHQYASFNCCKTHAFVHLICVKCFNIYHKRCLSQIQDKFTILGGHKIICCEQDTIVTESNDNSILEQTVTVLAEDNVQKDNYLSKLKKEKELLIHEALEMEEKLNQQLENQKKIISELQECINKLVKKKSVESVLTQTSPPKTKVQETSTNELSISKNNMWTQTDDCQNKKKTMKSVTIQTPKNDTKSQATSTEKSCNSTNDISTQTDGCKNTRLNKSENYHHKNIRINKNKILLIGDNSLRNMSLAMKMSLSTYEITSIVKSNARYHQIVDGIAALTKDYGGDDYVVIWGGILDAKTSTVSTPVAFDKLKEISMKTNILILSLPLRENKKVLNMFIDRFNIDLYTKISHNLKHNSKLLFLNINALLSMKDYRHRKSDSYLKKSGLNKVVNFLNRIVRGNLTTTDHKLILLNNLRVINKTTPANGTQCIISTESSSGKNLENERKSLQNFFRI